MRVSISDLEQAVNVVNHLKAHNRDCEYYIDCAYGGYSLYLRYPTSACDDVFRCGHIPKKELYYRITAFIAGLEEC